MPLWLPVMFAATGASSWLAVQGAVAIMDRKKPQEQEEGEEETVEEAREAAELRREELFEPDVKPYRDHGLDLEKMSDSITIEVDASIGAVKEYMMKAHILQLAWPEFGGAPGDVKIEDEWVMMEDDCEEMELKVQPVNVPLPGKRQHIKKLIHNRKMDREYKSMSRSFARCSGMLPLCSSIVGCVDLGPRFAVSEDKNNMYRLIVEEEWPGKETLYHVIDLTPIIPETTCVKVRYEYHLPHLKSEDARQVQDQIRHLLSSRMFSLWWDRCVRLFGQVAAEQLGAPEEEEDAPSEDERVDVAGECPMCGRELGMHHGTLHGACMHCFAINMSARRQVSM